MSSPPRAPPRRARDILRWMRPLATVAPLALALCVAPLACSREATRAAPVAALSPASGSASAAAPASASASGSAGVLELGRARPLVEGRASFEGMLLATKGGYMVRGAVLDDGDVRRAFASAGKPAVDPDGLLGAIVRVTGALRLHEVPAQPRDGGPIMQTRSGSWFSVTGLERLEEVAPAQMIEGKLARSKGFFSVGGRLVSRDDVAWALPGAKEGARVRLYGQPRDERCEPEAQCLIGGVLTLFDVGRGEVLP